MTIHKDGTGGASPQSVTFSFGANWRDFVDVCDESDLERALADIEKWVGAEGVRGKRVLDIGCGSGIHSLCFHRMGASEVVSFDFDPLSVAATSLMREKAGSPEAWRVESGSVLDETYLRFLGSFDLVYSWGVLHHTGSMWTAVENACHSVAPNGLLWIALYAKGDLYPGHLALKQKYNNANEPVKWLLRWNWIVGLMLRRLRRGRNPFGWNERRGRGMNVYHDIVDWLGGLPYEVASREETVSACRRNGLELVQFEEGRQGECSSYLFRRG